MPEKKVKKDSKDICTDENISYTRCDTGGANWCSAEYMAHKIGLSVVACTKFLNGPEFSNESALFMTPEQAELFSDTDLTREAEAEAEAEDKC